LPDGRLLINAARQKALLTLGEDGSLVTHADLSGLARVPPNNEIVVDARGNAYVDGGGFDLSSGEPFAPGMVALVTPDGVSREVADGIAFGNGMAIAPDDRTLIVAESYGRCLTAFEIADDGGLSDRRVWADLGDGVPDGICVDAEGAVWYADVPNKRCVRVREGGEVLATIDVDRGCFACMLGGDDGRILFIVAREWHGTDFAAGNGTGQVLMTPAPVAHAGRP
jgi:sugar lactone lactonase YvrE